MASNNKLADRLWDAQEERTPCPRLTEDEPKLTIEDAYQIQAINLQRRMNPRGLPPNQPRPKMVGRKIGLTSKAVQSWLNVSEPDFGGLLDEMAVPDGGTANIRKLLQPRVEGELAFVLKKALRGPGITAAHVLAATDFILPAIEIIDSRIQNWTLNIQDTIADNASSGMFVLGSAPVLPGAYNLRTIGCTLRKNGSIASTGAGAACLGNPVNAVVWLVNKLGELETGIEAGEVILSGALGPVSPVAGGDSITVQIGRMAEVSVSFS